MLKRLLLVQIIICAYLLVFNPCALTVANAKPLLGVKGQELCVRSQFSTSYKTSTKERCYNIALAVKKINGVFLDIGEEFSFNKVVGKRSKQNGFKMAKIIVNGMFVDGIGGGVCQVSTTLYNAVLRANLMVTEFHPHTLAVSYVEPSFDAMVNSGTADFKFINNTSMPVIIKAEAVDGVLSISIHGMAMREQIILTSKTVCEVDAPNSIYIDDESLFEGESEVITHPKKGLKSTAYITVVKDGKSVTRLLRKDYYKPIQGVVKRGVKKPLLDENPKEGVDTNGAFSRYRYALN